ncbi:MAG TPA: energy transducer TonB, partial [Segetibacter sp.]
WKRYLERNLNANVAADDGAPTGNYTVRVQFIVDKEGNISNVSAIEVPKACPSCGPEAVKVIKRGPKWEPAVQNGRNVIYQAVQHITFQVAEE